ncbi:MAG: hypothetical protein Q8P46_02280 [Hyphomicrobiales bacterium]|nr:hypothetical protein [Hyphomicrobiales bacterium]
MPEESSGDRGGRLGHATHIVDMTDETRRASYSAPSNTIIGVVLIGGGLFSRLARSFGIGAVLLAVAAMCLAAAVSAQGHEEV